MLKSNYKLNTFPRKKFKLIVKIEERCFLAFFIGRFSILHYISTPFRWPVYNFLGIPFAFLNQFSISRSNKDVHDF